VHWLYICLKIELIYYRNDDLKSCLRRREKHSAKTKKQSIHLENSRNEGMTTYFRREVEQIEDHERNVSRQLEDLNNSQSQK
jgi:hypothetical protein